MASSSDGCGSPSRKQQMAWYASLSARRLSEAAAENGVLMRRARRLAVGEDDAVHLVQHAQLLAGEGRRVVCGCSRDGGCIGGARACGSCFLLRTFWNDSFGELGRRGRPPVFECVSSLRPRNGGRIGRRKENLFGSREKESVQTIADVLGVEAESGRRDREGIGKEWRNKGEL